MAKFKVGDRVRCIDAKTSVYLDEGRFYTVVRLSPPGYVAVNAVDAEHIDYLDFRFEPVKDLKLERGATVRLKDGVDEWIVQHAPSGYADIARPDSGAFLYSLPHSKLVVVKEKPEDPKPDYYVNCKGAEPKDGDVFIDDSGNGAFIRGDYYHWFEGGRHALRAQGYSHSIGTLRKRTLVARDGKPYTG